MAAKTNDRNVKYWSSSGRKRGANCVKVKHWWRCLNQQDYFYMTNLLFSSMRGKKMGQWPIFRGASLRLPRLALPSLLRITPSLSQGFWTDKHWQRSPPHWTRGHLRGEETSLLLPSSNLVHKLNRSALVFWLARLVGVNGSEGVARSHGNIYEQTEDESWKEQETNINTALNFDGTVSPCVPSYTPDWSVLGFFFFGERKEKISKTHCKKVLLLGQIYVLRDVSENNFLSSQKPKPRWLLG